MGQESELQRLERFVAKLLTNFSELRAEKVLLSQQLDERNREIEELRGKLDAEKAERGEIGQRVGRLVEQIEDWERSLGDTDVSVAAPLDIEEAGTDDEVRVEYDAQVEFEEKNDQITEESRGEEEVRVQHNLFSLTGNAHR